MSCHELLTSCLPTRAQKESRLCATLGVAHDADKTRVNLHLVLENVECDGDLHDTVHDSDNWECLRSGGEDTGAKLKSHYATTDADDDAWAFVMPRSLKLTVAEDLARCVECLPPCYACTSTPLLRWPETETDLSTVLCQGASRAASCRRCALRYQTS